MNILKFGMRNFSGLHLFLDDFGFLGNLVGVDNVCGIGYFTQVFDRRSQRTHGDDDLILLQNRMNIF
jgi:hypothetical protein